VNQQPGQGELQEQSLVLQIIHSMLYEDRIDRSGFHFAAALRPDIRVIGCDGLGEADDVVGVPGNFLDAFQADLGEMDRQGKLRQVSCFPEDWAHVASHQIEVLFED
jgi:hypothetical protein